MTPIEEQYPFLIDKLQKHIEEVRNEDNTAAMIDIIMDYALHNDIDLELIGDAIQNDVYLKSFIEKDCEHHNIIASNKNKIGEW